MPLSISISQPLAFAAIPLWLIGLWKGRRLRAVRACPYFWPIVAFSVVALVVSALGVRAGHSLGKCHRLLMLAIPFMLCDAFREDASEGGKWLGLEQVTLALLAGVCLLGLYDVVRVPLAMWHGTRLFDAGNMRDPQFYMVALCFLLAHRLAGGREMRRGGWAVAVVLAGLGLLLHCKRGVWASFLLAASLLGTLARRYRIPAVIAAIALALAAVPEVRERIRYTQDEWSVKEGGRYALWTRVAPAMLKEYPWGMGLCAPTHEDLAQHSRYLQPRLNHLHNNLLEVALELGWIGLGVWLAWMTTAAVVLAAGYRAAKAAARPEAWVALGGLGAFAGLMINGLVEYNFGDSEILMLLCLIMGVSCILWERRRASPGASS